MDYSTSISWSRDEVALFCGETQEGYDFIIPLRITPTTFISGTDYQENGWEIAAIDYPRLDFSPIQIRDFMLHLARCVLIKFGQKTICIIDNETIEMIT